MRVVEIYVHPVKSMRGNAVGAWTVEDLGLQHDRRWMVVDAHQRFVTGRQIPALARCRALASGDRLRLLYEDSHIDVDMTSTRDDVDVVVWRDTCRARDAGDAVAQWLTERFDRPLRLVWQADTRVRPIAEGKRVTPDDVVSFADGYPLLATTTASLAELNGRLRQQVGMRNFRPNLVIETDAAFAEDDWHTIAIGGVRFRVTSPCARCVFTTVDPASGSKREDREPLATLSTYRRDAETGKINFGVNLIPLDRGQVSIGDTVSLM